MSASNSGKWLEKLVEMIAGEYERKRVLRLRKSDPPTAFVRGRMINLRNPWPDFVGSWTSNGGRMLMAECKSTKEPFLPLGYSGVTDEQIDSLRQWASSGAACFVLWAHGDSDLYLIPIDTILARVKDPGAVRRLKPGEAGVWKVEPGLGRVRWDFERTARLRWP